MAARRTGSSAVSVDARRGGGPSALGENNAQAVAEVAGLRVAPVGKEEEGGVGEDAVHVGEEQAERAAAGRQRLVLHIISVFHRSWRWTTPSTTPAASTTGREV